MATSALFFFQAEDGIRDPEMSRGLGDVYKRQIVTMPDLIVPLLSFYGFLLVFLLSTFFYLTPERTNIILTVDEIRFREGVWFNRKPMAITWDNICEINYKKIKSGKYNGVEQECFELHLKEKDSHKEDKPHRIEYSSGPKAKLGRRVKYSSKNINANNAAQLIRDLMNASSNKKRTKIVSKKIGYKSSKGSH